MMRRMSEQSRVGDLLAGKYQLEALLGSGGVGMVYRAQNTLVGRTVAIKLMRPEHVSDPKVVGRFLREARAANIVRHPNVVDVLDIDQDETGAPFIVQEFLEGQDLGRLVKSHKAGLPVDWVLATMIPIVEAVALAHSRGVVHRDLKPENVFLARINRETVPKLLDFGISYIRPSPGDIRMTATGTTLGTPAFMSPEQLGGTQAVDARSDVWSLGVILFEALSGRLPFDADSAAMLFAQIAWAVPPRLDEVAPKVPRDLSRVVARCLRRDKDERYPSAAELARDLRLIQAGAEVEPSQKRSLPPQAPLFPVAPDAEVIQKAPPAPRLPSLEVPGRPGPAPSPPSNREPRAGTDASAALGVERFGSDFDNPPSNRGGRSDPRVVPLAAQIEDSTLSANSGISLATLRPKASEPEPSDDAELAVDPSKVWASTVMIVTALATVAVLMALVHRTDGWPVTTWMRPVLQGTSPGLDLLASALAALSGTSLGSRVIRQPPRPWSLAIAALGMIWIGLGSALRAAFVLLASRSPFSEGPMPGALVAFALVPLGLGLQSIKTAWDYWETDGDFRSRATTVSLTALGAAGLFAAAEILRAAAM